MYDPCHPIIDDVYFEFTGVTELFQVQEQTGDFGRSTIELSVNAICAQDYNGTDCNTFCEEINGTLTCREDDNLVTTATSVINPMSSETICTTQGATDDTSTSTIPERDTDPTTTSGQIISAQDADSIDRSTSIAKLLQPLPGGGSPTAPVDGGLTRRSDNTLVIAVGVGVGGAVLLCLLVGLIILLLCLVGRVRRNKRKSK